MNFDEFSNNLIMNLQMPVYTAATTAGFDGSVVVENLLKQDNPNVGFDPTTGVFFPPYPQQNMRKSFFSGFLCSYFCARSKLDKNAFHICL